METELGRDKNYVDGLRQLVREVQADRVEEPFAKLSEELADYDTWIRGTVMPKARTDFKLAPEEYALSAGELRSRYPAGATGGDGA